MSAASKGSVLSAGSSGATLGDPAPARGRVALTVAVVAALLVRATRGSQTGAQPPIGAPPPASTPAGSPLSA